ncbi:CdaR family transcriptional regulator [Helcococcus massiliensis]|uniref:CdaR family transcriptional regulator n=1 Tax=Helcococcus massiliensis TaxID=2040290 RepID=UPI0013562FFF|nr:sugar diacid recognition domain-containing protein [Helcococcus massiliensis]
MEISNKLANSIVQELKDIISFNLNYMDKKGKIIASTDPARIGQVNMASFESMNINKMIVVEKDGQFQNAKKGINIPVNFENEIIGTIGITGDPHDVINYATIIKKMTEILITKEWIDNVKQNEIDKKKIFLENLIFSSTSEDLYSYPINNTTNKVIIDSLTFPKLNDPILNNKVLEITNAILNKHNFQYYSAIIQDNLIILIDKYNKETLDPIIMKLSETLLSKLEIKSFYGISSIYKEIEDTPLKFEEAKSSMNWITKINDDEAMSMYYNKLDLGILFKNTSKDQINQYKEKILSNLSQDEIEEYKDIMLSYTKNNGSIKKTSEDLFIHKNTLQYKLNNIYKKTGYNPRKLSDYIVLRFAFLLK